MSDVEQRKPTKITFRDLIMAAQSGDANTRKQAWGAFNAWMKVAPQIPARDRLSYMQCDMLRKIFATKGFGSVAQQPKPRSR